jgi:hypothetical protein
MTKFGHLKALDVQDKTAEYTIYQIAGEPTLILKSATEENKGYFNAILRRSRRNMQAFKAGAVNKKILDENRREDKELYPKYVIQGWRNVKDSEGNAVEFSKDECADFLDALPNWIFDEIRAFAGESSNFSGELSIDIEEKLGN